MVAPAMPAHEDDSVIFATDEDLREALVNALRVADSTYEELEEQARSGAFKSAAAHRAWPVVRGLTNYR